MIRKIIKVLSNESRQRGLYYFFVMYLSNFFALLRGWRFKVKFLKNIDSSFLALGSKSRIEIFNKKAKAKFGSFVFIRNNTAMRIDFDGEFIVGEKVFINDNCTINCVKKIEIGDYTKIGPNVCINDHDHNYRKEIDDHLLRGEVIIGKNVWIGSNVVILRDTYIGDNAVIAAGSVVKGTVPEGAVFLNKRVNEIRNV
ncbi:MAG: acyltransferase [Bacillaceae bacterium]